MGDDSLRDLDRIRVGGHASGPVDECSDDTREAWTKAFELRVRGYHSDALAYCERALKLDPGQWRLWGEYGSALFAKDRFREGVEAFLHALTLHPCSAWLWGWTGGQFSVQVRYQKALKCFVVAECLGHEHAAEAARDMSECLQRYGVTKAETDRIVDQVRQSLPAAPRDHQQMVDLIGALKLRDTDERVSDLHSRAARFLTGPYIISELVGTCVTLVGRYLAGAAWDDAELGKLLSRCIIASQNEAANCEGDEGSKDARVIYQRAAALLQEIQAEVSASRV